MENTYTPITPNEPGSTPLKEWTIPLVVEIEILANNPFAEDGHPLAS